MASRRGAGAKCRCFSNLKISLRFPPGVTTDVLSWKHLYFALFALLLCCGSFWVTTITSY